jgi:hypothetical protein
MFILTQPMPSNESAARAAAIAWKLCMTMPKHFEDENSRQEDLFDDLRNLFPDSVIPKKSFDSANPDGVIMHSDGSIGAVIELKNEPGAAGDVYMQCARSFDAAAIVQLKKKETAQCSALVICVDGEQEIILQLNTNNDYIGPSILICGGFKDKDPSVVEPLSQWCSMLPDDLGVRQEVLAKHLYALQVTLHQLKAP